MDTQSSHDIFDDLVERWYDGRSKYEEGLENIEDKMWPERQISFREIIPISAKYSPQTVQYVKDRIRNHLDSIEDEKTKFLEKIHSFSEELDINNIDTGPRIA